MNADFKDNLNDKIQSENLVLNLNDSLTNTIENTNEILKKILENIEINIKDEQIKNESKKLIFSIQEQLKNILDKKLLEEE